MRNRLRTILCCLIGLPLCGCSVLGQDPVSGYLFTSMTVPYSVDLNNTPVPDRSGSGSIVRIREPITQAGLYTELNTNAIADIGRKYGLEKVYFADMKTFSIFSVWRTQTLILYGEGIDREVAEAIPAEE